MGICIVAMVGRSRSPAICGASRGFRPFSPKFGRIPLKKLLLLSVLVLAAVLVGCGDDNAVAPTAETDLADGSVFQRPEFIDTRPEAVQLQNTLAAKDVFGVKPVDDAKSGKYALVIGISDYAGTANDLNYCDDDAQDWKSRLQSEGYQVTTLIDGQATAAAIQAEVADLVALSTAGNEIALTYSGHGSRGKIVTADLTYITAEWFGGMFDGCGSTKMAFAFDACQIGEMATALNANGRVIAVASNKNRYSYDGDATMQNGVFTYYQMEGFDDVGFIYYEDDCAYAVQKMFDWASQYRGVKVAPSYTDSYVGDLDL